MIRSSSGGLQKARDIFLELAGRHPSEIHVIDAGKSLREVINEALNQVLAFLGAPPIEGAAGLVPA